MKYEKWQFTSLPEDSTVGAVNANCTVFSVNGDGFFIIFSQSTEVKNLYLRSVLSTYTCIVSLIHAQNLLKILLNQRYQSSANTIKPNVAIFIQRYINPANLTVFFPCVSHTKKHTCKTPKKYCNTSNQKHTSTYQYIYHVPGSFWSTNKLFIFFLLETLTKKHLTLENLTAI